MPCRMKVLVCCCVLSVLAVCETRARSLDYPGLVSQYADYIHNNPHGGLLLNRKRWSDYPLESNSMSEIPLHSKRSGYGDYTGYKRSSLNELIQRLMALRGGSRETGRASMMRFGAGRRR